MDPYADLAIPIKYMPYNVRLGLAQKLDPESTVNGNNWRLLADSLDYSFQDIMNIETRQTSNIGSGCTMKLLEDYEQKTDSSIKQLCLALTEIKRPDALQVITNDIPKIRKQLSTHIQRGNSLMNDVSSCSDSQQYRCISCGGSGQSTEMNHTCLSSDRSSAAAVRHPARSISVDHRQQNCGGGQCIQPTLHDNLPQRAHCSVSQSHHSSNPRIPHGQQNDMLSHTPNHRSNNNQLRLIPQMLPPNIDLQGPSDRKESNIPAVHQLNNHTELARWPSGEDNNANFSSDESNFASCSMNVNYNSRPAVQKLREVEQNSMSDGRFETPAHFDEVLLRQQLEQLRSVPRLCAPGDMEVAAEEEVYTSSESSAEYERIHDCVVPAICGSSVACNINMRKQRDRANINGAGRRKSKRSSASSSGSFTSPESISPMTSLPKDNCPDLNFDPVITTRMQKTVISGSGPVSSIFPPDVSTSLTSSCYEKKFKPNISSWHEEMVLQTDPLDLSVIMTDNDSVDNDGRFVGSGSANLEHGAQIEPLDSSIGSDDNSMFMDFSNYDIEAIPPLSSGIGTNKPRVLEVAQDGKNVHNLQAGRLYPRERYQQFQQRNTEGANSPIIKCNRRHKHQVQDGHQISMPSSSSPKVKVKVEPMYESCNSVIHNINNDSRAIRSLPDEANGRNLLLKFAKMKQSKSTSSIREYSHSDSETECVSLSAESLASETESRLMPKMKTEFKKVKRTVRIFLTYANDNERHIRRVQSLYACLTKNGFACNLDILERKLMMPDKIGWYDSRYQKADFILVCISHEYRRQVDTDTEIDTQSEDSLHGKYIYKLMHTEFAQNGSRNTRFVPLIFPGADKSMVPIWLQNTLIYNWPKQYKDLLWMLTKPEEKIKTKSGSDNR